MHGLLHLWARNNTQMKSTVREIILRLCTKKTNLTDLSTSQQCERFIACEITVIREAAETSRDLQREFKQVFPDDRRSSLDVLELHSERMQHLTRWMEECARLKPSLELMMSLSRDPEFLCRVLPDLLPELSLVLIDAILKPLGNRKIQGDRVVVALEMKCFPIQSSEVSMQVQTLHQTLHELLKVILNVLCQCAKSSMGRKALWKEAILKKMSLDPWSLMSVSPNVAADVLDFCRCVVKICQKQTLQNIESVHSEEELMECKGYAERE